MLIIAFAGIAGAIALSFWWSDPDGKPVVINNTPAPPVPTLDSARIAQGAALYAQYCAVCHGPNLEGAPDWKRTLLDGSLPPPPQDSSGHTWHHPDSLLASIISKGGDPAYNSKMPAFGDQLSADEIGVILDFIKGSWGREEREYQWWLTVTQGNP
jgi:mono/diheme cytochrome c family protein